MLYWEDMEKMGPREIIGLVETALAGRDAAAVPCSELVDALPNNPQIRKVIDACRGKTADILLIALERIALFKERQARRRGAESIGFDTGDTQLGPQMSDEDRLND